ncbi:MAG: PASTA domain-containing protein [Oscillospiraceae bacterium]|nr:PASTA domain-containing protein [Oscillospiraceae bacterium]
MMNRKIFNVLDNAEDEIIEILSSFTDDDDEVKKRILDMSERKFKEMTSAEQAEKLNRNNEKEIQVTINSRHHLTRILSAAAVIAIIAGVGTSVHRHMENLKYPDLPAAVSPETTELPAVTEAAETTEISEQSDIPPVNTLKTYFHGYFDVYFLMAYIGTDDVTELMGESEKVSILQYVKDKDESDQDSENEYIDLDGKLYEYKDYYLIGDPELQDYEKFIDYMAKFFTDPFHVYLDKTTIGTDIGDAEIIPENDNNIDKTVIGIGGKTYVRKSNESWPFAYCNMNEPVFENYCRGKNGDLYGEKMYLYQDRETGNNMLRSYVLHLVMNNKDPKTFKFSDYKIESAVFGESKFHDDADLSAIKFEDYSYIKNFMRETETKEVFDNAKRIEAENSEKSDLPLVPEINREFTEVQAKDKLEEYNYTTQTKLVYDDTIPEGYIIKTDPPAGTPYEEGNTVLIYVSRGKMSKQLLFPDVNGKPVDEVKKMLEDLGVTTVMFSDTYSEEYPEGIVIGSNYSANDIVESEYDRIILYVSSKNSVQDQAADS